VVGFIAVAGIAALAGCAREPSSLQGSRSLDDLEQAIVELPTRYPPVARIVAVDELHGDIEATDRALRLAGAIDANARWVGGNLVVVQRDHIVPACGGAVWRVDVGLSAYYGGPTEALEIAGGQTRVLSSAPLPS